MKDTIYRDDAVALVIKAIHGTDNKEIQNYLLDGLRKQMWSLQSAEAVQWWIPCSERLPKAEYGESDCVLATCSWKSDTKQRWTEKLYFNGGNWCYPTGECFTHKVIAWKPMPEPYREDDKE